MGPVVLKQLMQEVVWELLESGVGVVPEDYLGKDDETPMLRLFPSFYKDYKEYTIPRSIFKDLCASYMGSAREIADHIIMNIKREFHE